MSAPTDGEVSARAQAPSSQLPAIATPPAGVTPFDQLRLQIWHSLPNTAADKARIIGLVQGDPRTVPLSVHIGQILKVEHVVVHRIDLIDEDTGEVEEADRIVLIDESGESYACVSRGIRRSIQVLAAMYGLPPWRPALTLRMNQISTRKGRRTFTLTPVVEIVKEAKAPAAEK